MATRSSRLENPMDRGAWQAIVHGVTKSQMWLSTHTHTHPCTRARAHAHMHRKRKQDHEEVCWRGVCENHGEGFEFSQTMNLGSLNKLYPKPKENGGSTVHFCSMIYQEFQF